MKILISKAYTLEKTPNSCSFSLYINGKNREQIYESISQILSNICYTCYDNQNEKIVFLAETVITLSDFCKKDNQDQKEQILLEKTKYMIKMLSNQIEILKTKNLAFYGFDLDDVLMINDNIFIIVNANNILELDKERKSYITFNAPFDLPYFSSPELLELKTLPAKIDYRTSYYSLGALITYFLLKEYLFVGNEVMREKAIEKCLNPIFNTKVYWFLKRCLKEKSNERNLLFI
jgi:hypothetical protein